MENDCLSKVVVDVQSRKFYLYSDNGDEKVLDCESPQQFMDVLEVCRKLLDERILKYASVVWGKTPAFQADVTGSIPVTRLYWECGGIGRHTRLKIC